MRQYLPLLAVAMVFAFTTATGCSLFGCVGEIIKDVNEGVDEASDGIVGGEIIDGIGHGVAGDAVSGAAADGNGNEIGNLLGGAGRGHVGKKIKKFMKQN